MIKRYRNYIFIALGVFLLLAILNYEVISRYSWKHWHLPLSGRVIVIDPGHGGPDGGAVGGDIQEADVALNISHELRDYLQEAGALVYLTREDNQDLASPDTKGLSRRKAEDLRNRVAFIQKHDPDLVISIHLNAIPSSQWRGAQTFFDPKDTENQKAAKFIQDSLRNQLQNTNRYAKAISSLYILKRIDSPAALVEVGFLSNPTERELLNTKTYQDKVSAAIYQGIMRYYTKEPVPHS